MDDFADTIKALRGLRGIDLAKVGVSAESIKFRHTREGHLLVKLGKSKGSEVVEGKLSIAISSALGNQVSTVSQFGRNVEIEVVDIDTAVDKAELLSAVFEAIRYIYEDPAAKSDRDLVIITGL